MVPGPGSDKLWATLPFVWAVGMVSAGLDAILKKSSLNEAVIVNRG